MATLLKHVCDSMAAAGRLSGDSLLDVRNRQLKVDDSYRVTRFVLSLLGRSGRGPVLHEMRVLLSQARDLCNLLVHSKHWQWDTMGRHELALREAAVGTRQLEQLAAAVTKYARGMQAQELHYRKIPDATTADGFETLVSESHVLLDWLQPRLDDAKRRLAEWSTATGLDVTIGLGESIL